MEVMTPWLDRPLRSRRMVGGGEARGTIRQRGTPYRHTNWPRNASHIRRTRRTLVIDRQARALGKEDVESHWAPVNATSKEHHQPGGASSDVDAAGIEHAMHDRSRRPSALPDY
jgi:hypothetical protein